MSKTTPYLISTKSQSIPGTGSDSVWSFAQRVNTDISTNLNNLTQTTVPMDGAMITSHTGFAINGNGIQLIGPAAYVRCSFNIFVNAAVARANMTVRLNSSVLGLFGPVAAHGYIRNATGHQNASYCIPGFWTKMATNEIITVQSLQEAAAGSVSMGLAGTSFLLLETLKNV